LDGGRPLLTVVAATRGSSINRQTKSAIFEADFCYLKRLKQHSRPQTRDELLWKLICSDDDNRFEFGLEITLNDLQPEL